jgi:hypothetical protein
MCGTICSLESTYAGFVFVFARKRNIFSRPGNMNIFNLGTHDVFKAVGF